MISQIAQMICFGGFPFFFIVAARKQISYQVRQMIPQIYPMISRS